MNRKKLSFLLIPAICVLCCSLKLGPADKNWISIDQALKLSLVTAEIKGLGGHTGECVSLKIKNISPYDTTLRLQPGWRLVSTDSTVQDILVIKQQEFRLASNEEKVINAYGFCCQAHNSSPETGEAFEIGFMADSNLARLARYLNTHKLPENVQQSAVWVLSDGNHISSIPADDSTYKESIRELHRFVAALIGSKVDFSWYYITYKKDTARLFSGVPDSLFGDFDYQLWNNDAVSLIMYNDKREVIQRFFVDKPHNPDKFRYSLKMSVAGLPKGNYYLRLYAGNQKKAEKLVELQ